MLELLGSEGPHGPTGVTPNRGQSGSHGRPAHPPGTRRIVL